MPRDGSGNYSRTTSTSSGGTAWADEAAIDPTIFASEHDIHDEDMATALSASLVADGQKVPTANLPMGGFVHTGVGDATARTHYSAAKQIQDNSLVFGGNSGGSSSAYTITLIPAITAYVNGAIFSFRAHTANAINATLNVSGVGAKNIKHLGTRANVAANDIATGSNVVVMYNSIDTCMYILNVVDVTRLSGLATSGNVTIGGTSALNGNVTVSASKTLSVETIISADAVAITPTSTFDVTCTGASIISSGTATYRGTVVSLDASDHISLKISTTERGKIYYTSSLYTFEPAADNSWQFGTSSKAIQTVYAYGISAKSGTAANLTLAGGTGYGIAFCVNGNATARMKLNDAGATYLMDFITDNEWTLGSATAAAQTVYTYGVSAKSSTATNLTLMGGVGYGINFCPNGDASPDLALNSTGKLVFTPGTAFGTSSKNPATDAAAGWIEIVIGGASKYVPYYAA